MYGQNAAGISTRQASMFTPVHSASRVSGIGAVGGTVARQASSMQIMRVYVIQEAPKTFIRSQRFAQAQGTYRMDGDPDRYKEWAGQENQQSSVTGLHQLRAEDDGFIQKHLDRLSQWNSLAENESAVQQMALDDTAEPAREDADHSEPAEEENSSTGKVNKQPQTEEQIKADAAERQPATVARQEQQRLSPQTHSAVAGMAAAQILR